MGAEIKSLLHVANRICDRHCCEKTGRETSCGCCLGWSDLSFLFTENGGF